ncbi:glutathione hydrolase 7-like [Periplaneta americana]|uniref:glutathione hydrolase 7-like n=1 Tax=Periplaneta americana TaxID=6978 RepID=UPI0037E74DC2
MNNINNGTSTNETGGSTPAIPGPYRSPEQTEAFPLKQSLYRRNVGATSRGKGLTIFTQWCSGSSDKSGASLRMIALCFGILTLAVIVALAIQIYYGDYQLVPHGSVATDNQNCSIIGTDVLKRGGNAVDAAVAATFCLGVVNPHVTGLGGGGFMTIYSHRKRSVLDVIDFREVAPSSVSFSAEKPGSYVGVPGMLRGLALAHQRYGLLPWKDVVMPAVRIARSGFQVPATLVSAKSLLKSNIFNKGLINWVESLEAGQPIAVPDLAIALELIAEKGADVFYNGSLADDILTTVREAGGEMTKHDLSNYQAVNRFALETTFGDFRVMVPDAPSGGPALLAVLKLLPSLNTSISEIVRLAIAIEDTYRKARDGDWGEPDFPTDSHVMDSFSVNSSLTQYVGSHVAAADLNDIYVSVVSGLSSWFGSQLRTKRGFILNNAMTNFGVGKNSPSPGKRPLSFATPVIAVEKKRICGRRLILGSGDATIAAQLLSHLVDKNVSWIVEAPRFHVVEGNIISEEVHHLPSLSTADKEQFISSHYLLRNLSEPYQSCNIVEKVADDLASHSDSRGHGLASRF